MTGGICFPEGALTDVSAFEVELIGDGDGPVSRTAMASNRSSSSRSFPAQVDVLNRWKDGSVRWALVSSLLPACDVAGFDDDSFGGDTHAPSEEVSVRLIPVEQPEESEDYSLLVSKFSQGQITTESRVLSDTVPRESVLHLKPVLKFHDSSVAEFLCDAIREETVGPVRRVVHIHLRVKTMPWLTLRLRLTQWAAADLWQVESRFRNTRRAAHRHGLWDLGDSNALRFRSLEIEIRGDQENQPEELYWRAERESEICRKAITADHVSANSHCLLKLVQSGSGGPEWNSSNHCDADGRCTVSSQGYELTLGTTRIQGLRAEPSVVLCSKNASLGVSVPEFWQQFPGSVTVGISNITVGLIASCSGDSETSAYHELQGGEQKTRQFWIQQTQRFDDGSSSVSTLRGVAERSLNFMETLTELPQLRQNPTDYISFRAFPWLPNAVSGWTAPMDAPSIQREDSGRLRRPRCGDLTRLAQYLRDATSGECTISARRDRIDEYGWRNFGDVHADHEQTHFAGSETVISHYNNQFDMILGGIQLYALTGDSRWRDLFDPLARHVMDIDVYHTEQDRPAFNGGLFWHTDHYVDARTSTHRTYSAQNAKPGQSYGGGPSCEHNYTTGLLYYYFLTGNPEARDTVLSLADWVIAMDDGSRTVFGLIDDGPTGNASSTVWEDYHGPGRGPGNSINALVDGWILTGQLRYMQKAEELIRRCVHPKQDLDGLHLSDAEGHWSYTVFLTSLSRYLVIKRDAGQCDADYAFARAVMAHYGRWMLANEQPTLNRPESLQYPTEAWAAQDFRKANVLRLAACCEDDHGTATLMRTRANELNDQAWEDLYSFGSAHLTARCLSILMTEGLRDLYHRTEPSITLPSVMAPLTLPDWEMFVPQKIRVKRLLKSPVRLIPAILRALNPKRLRAAWDALHRQF